VQNARSLKISGTCNLKTRVFHRVFHSFCGKVVGALSEAKSFKMGIRINMGGQDGQDKSGMKKQD
jgi:hypothetical protein